MISLFLLMVKFRLSSQHCLSPQSWLWYSFHKALGFLSFISCSWVNFQPIPLLLSPACPFISLLPFFSCHAVGWEQRECPWRAGRCSRACLATTATCFWRKTPLNSGGLPNFAPVPPYLRPMMKGYQYQKVQTPETTQSYLVFSEVCCAPSKPTLFQTVKQNGHIII